MSLSRHFFYTLLFLMISVNTLLAAKDSDLDGVADEKDLCPNTSFELSVDHKGCPKTNDLTLLLGHSISQGTYGGTQSVESQATTFYASLKRDVWSYAAYTSSVETTSASSSSKGQGDIYGTVTYSGLGREDRLLSLIASVKFATADTTVGTGENDYGIRLKSTIIDEDRSYLASIGYTVTGDTASTIYEDVLSLSLGLGLQKSKNLYISGSFNFVDAYVAGDAASKTAVLYTAYTIDSQWFFTASYTLGLSDAVADQSIDMALGFKF